MRCMLLDNRKRHRYRVSQRTQMKCWCTFPNNCTVNLSLKIQFLFPFEIGAYTVGIIINVIPERNFLGLCSTKRNN